MALTFLHLHTGTQTHPHSHTHTGRQAETQSHSRASVLSFLSLDYIKIASAIRICGTKFTFHFALISCHTLFFASLLLRLLLAFLLTFCSASCGFLKCNQFSTPRTEHTHRHRQFCTHTHIHRRGTHTSLARTVRVLLLRGCCQRSARKRYGSCAAPSLGPEPRRRRRSRTAEQATRPITSCLPGSPAAGHIVRHSLSSFLSLSCALFSLGTDILYLIT